VTNVAKVLNQRKVEKSPTLKKRMSVAHEAAEYLQTGEKLRKKSKIQLLESYQKASSDGKHSKTTRSSGAFKRSIDNHASYAKSRYIVTNPPSRDVRVHLAKEMKV
jgi:hypothetical protein